MRRSQENPNSLASAPTNGHVTETVAQKEQLADLRSKAPLSVVHTNKCAHSVPWQAYHHTIKSSANSSKAIPALPGKVLNCYSITEGETKACFPG
eukprot:scaffold91117_cov19-Tisochrysis_lutea.AAC.4